MEVLATPEQLVLRIQYHGNLSFERVAIFRRFFIFDPLTKDIHVFFFFFFSC